MKHIKQTVKSYKRRLLNYRNVVGVGVGIKEKNRRSTGTPAVVVLVNKKLPESKLKKQDVIPKSINDIQTDVIEVGDVRLLQEITRTEKHRPAFPGLSIGHYKISAGTFGAVVRDKATGKLLILSNNHVLANKTNGNDNRAQEGDPVLQPGPYDGGSKDKDMIAGLRKYVPLIREVETSRCPMATSAAFFLNSIIAPVRPGYRVKFEKIQLKENTVDAAVAEPVSSGVVDNVIYELGEIKGKRKAELGLDVVKSGRTSGITRAKVKALDATLRVALGDEEYAYFDEQIVTGPLAQPGDSGSLVLDSENKAVGLLFAGSDETSVVNHIEAVEEKLNIEVYY